MALLLPRGVRPFALILLPRACQCHPHVVQRAEQCAFRHSSRSRPWKLSTCRFCIGMRPAG
jgi:hypothetical protein